MSFTTQRTPFIGTSIAMVAFVALSLGACVGAPEVPSSDREEPADVEAEEPDGVNDSNWTFFEMKASDTRRCISPVCGGMFIGRVNQPTTRCADGTWQDQCYVAQYDLSAIASGEALIQLQNEARSDLLLVRGELKKGFYPDFPEIAVLSVTGVYRAATEVQPTGLYYRAHDLGLRCITSPCVGTELVRLNHNLNPDSRVAGVDFTSVAATEEQVAAAWETMRGTNILVAGALKEVKGPGGTANTLVASQLFMPYLGDSAVGQVCGGRTGPCPDAYTCQFRDAVCDHADGTGVCELKPAVCAPEDAPVCGCDGVTYENDCVRRQMGAGFGTPGACELNGGAAQVP